MGTFRNEGVAFNLRMISPPSTHRLLTCLRRVFRESWIWIAGSWVRYPYQEHLFQLPPELAYESVSGLMEVAANGHGRPANFREWIEAVRRIGELREVRGAHWDLELGTIVDRYQRRMG